MNDIEDELRRRLDDAAGSGGPVDLSTDTLLAGARNRLRRRRMRVVSLVTVALVAAGGTAAGFATAGGDGSREVVTAAPPATAARSREVVSPAAPAAAAPPVCPTTYRPNMKNGAPFLALLEPILPAAVSAIVVCHYGRTGGAPTPLYAAISLPGSSLAKVVAGLRSAADATVGVRLLCASAPPEGVVSILVRTGREIVVLQPMIGCHTIDYTDGTHDIDVSAETEGLLEAAQGYGRAVLQLPAAARTAGFELKVSAHGIDLGAGLAAVDGTVLLPPGTYTFGGKVGGVPSSCTHTATIAPGGSVHVTLGC